MYDISGHIIFQQEVFSPAGSGIFKLEVPAIKSGVYIITLKTLNDRLLGVRKVVKE